MIYHSISQYNILYTTIREVKAYALFKVFSGVTKSVAKISVGPVGRVS